MTPQVWATETMRHCYAKTTPQFTHIILIVLATLQLTLEENKF